MSFDDVVEKYRANARLGLGGNDVSRLESAVLSLESERDLSVAELLGQVRSEKEGR